MDDSSQAILPGSKHVTSLATSAVIVDMRETVYTGQHSDSKLADKVSDSEGAAKGVRALKISHDLFVGDKDLHALLTSRQARYNWLKRSTFPWAGSLCLLPSYKLVQFMREFEEHKQQHAALVENFAHNLNDRISNAAIRRGLMFNRADYPTEDQIRASFTLKLAIMEVPTGDFRNAIAEVQAAELKALFNDQAVEYMKQHAVERKEKLKKLMTSISNSCEVITERVDGELKTKRRNLHAATIQNAIDQCDDIKKFNPIEDDELEAMRSELAKILDSINIDAVRENDNLRTKLKTEVDHILSKF